MKQSPKRNTIVSGTLGQNHFLHKLKIYIKVTKQKENNTVVISLVTNVLQHYFFFATQLVLKQHSAAKNSMSHLVVFGHKRMLRNTTMFHTVQLGAQGMSNKKRSKTKMAHDTTLCHTTVRHRAKSSDQDVARS